MYTLHRPQGILEHSSGVQVFAYHEDHSVQVSGGHKRIGDDADRRKIQYQIIKFPAYGVQRVLHAGGAQQLGRVRRDRTGRYGIKCGVAVAADICKAFPGVAADKEACHTRAFILYMEPPRYGRKAEVTVDQAYVFACLCQDIGEIDRGRRLSL